ncbi:thiamine phosphate synthase [Longispora albida]|uniref:thiamine phosphate synthase n=1 Tax=Longispora albida TaxID=203523 RepID=UPI0003AAA539|nr:thiamine phosphate synthase [Longispora albida]
MILDRPSLAAPVIDGGASLLATLDFTGGYARHVTSLGARLLNVCDPDSPPDNREGVLFRAHALSEVDHSFEFVSLSPIFETESKPGYGPPLGLSGLTGLYALGGIDTPAKAQQCVEAGAAGVVVMGAVTRSDNPTRTVASFVEALS